MHPGGILCKDVHTESLDLPSKRDFHCTQKKMDCVFPFMVKKPNIFIYTVRRVLAELLRELIFSSVEKLMEIIFFLFIYHIKIKWKSGQLRAMDDYVNFNQNIFLI
jgi:hypothetical protein